MNRRADRLRDRPRAGVRTDVDGRARTLAASDEAELSIVVGHLDHAYTNEAPPR